MLYIWIPDWVWLLKIDLGTFTQLFSLSDALLWLTVSVWFLVCTWGSFRYFWVFLKAQCGCDGLCEHLLVFWLLWILHVYHGYEYQQLWHSCGIPKWKHLCLYPSSNVHPRHLGHFWCQHLTFFWLYVIFFVVFILLVLFYFICALNFHHTFINFFWINYYFFHCVLYVCLPEFVESAWGQYLCEAQ